MKPQHSAKKRGKPMKSELVMILAAMASALVLMGMLIACIPYYDTGTREIADPEPLLQQQRERNKQQGPEQTNYQRQEESKHEYSENNLWRELDG